MWAGLRVPAPQGHTDITPGPAACRRCRRQFHAANLVGQVLDPGRTRGRRRLSQRGAVDGEPAVITGGPAEEADYNLSPMEFEARAILA
jgi:hypothetical protein